MQGKPAIDPRKAAAIRAHLAQLRLQRENIDAVIETLEDDLNPPPQPVEEPAPAPRHVLTFPQPLDLPRAA